MVKKMSTAKKIMKSFGYLFVGMLVALCVYTFIVTDVLKKDYANVFGYTYFVVATGSMSGTIEVNDVVIVKIGEEANINDIITYKTEEGEFITHRVVKKIGDQLITQGDVNNTEDEPISKDDIVGQVKMVISQPTTFEQAANICDLLKQKKSVIVNLEYVNKDVARRIIDVVSGAVHALDGHIQKISNSIVLIAPFNYDIENEMARDEIKNKLSVSWLRNGNNQ